MRHPAGAVPHATQVLALRDPKATSPALLAEDRLRLARAFWDGRGPGLAGRPRARTLAAEARDSLRDVPTAADALDRIEAWLAQHSEP